MVKSRDILLGAIRDELAGEYKAGHTIDPFVNFNQFSADTPACATVFRFIADASVVIAEVSHLGAKVSVMVVMSGVVVGRGAIGVCDVRYAS